MKPITIGGKRSLALLAGLLLFVAACGTTPPPRPNVEPEPEKGSYKEGSLWPGKNKKNMFFSDNKASRIGDIVTVHVIEKTTAINKADTSDQSTVSDDLTLDTGGASATAFQLKGGNRFQGKGATSRSDLFSATVSCIVKEVLGNGNMVIEGQRRMQINDEEQYIVVRGVVRPEDITYNNTILSTQIAQADIMYTGGGAMDAARHPNWLGRAMRNVWPF